MAVTRGAEPIEAPVDPRSRSGAETAAGAGPSAAPEPARLRSLDALRGFDMFWITGGDALVHAFAAWTGWGIARTAADQMTHVAWNGFRFYDLIFPLFVFLSGVAIPFSLLRRVEEGVSRSRLALRALRRSLILVALGVFYNNGLFEVGLSAMRYPSVLGRIGLAYLGAALISLFTSLRGQVAWLVALLMAYWAILAFVPVPGAGAGVLTYEGSVVSYVDRAVVPGTLFVSADDLGLDDPTGRYAHGVHDPEGLLSTLPAIGSCLAGVLCGQYLRRAGATSARPAARDSARLAAAGAASLALGWAWGHLLPVNKNLWTPSFVAITAGWSMVGLALFHWLIDVRGWRRCAFPLLVIGSNSILVYLSSHFVDLGFTTNVVLAPVLSRLSEAAGGVVYWLGFIVIQWLGLWFLYRKRFFLRV